MAQAESTESSYLQLSSDHDDNPPIRDKAVTVNIALFGKAHSGRSSFVNAMLGWDENSKNGAKTSDHVEARNLPISYCDPQQSEGVIFTILPNLNTMPEPFERFVDSLSIEKFDAFLVFTAEEFTKNLLLFAKKIVSSKKPLFLIRTKIDKSDGTKKETEEFNEEILRKNLKERLEENSKETKFDYSKHQIYLISNSDPGKWDFLNLVKNIAQALPSLQKESFSKIFLMRNLDALEKFQNFVKEVDEQKKSATKSLPSVHESKHSVVGSGIVGMQRMMKEKLDGWKDVKLNLAILGESGVGKSSFINAIRGIRDNNDGDERVAKTGITETTSIPTRYEHPTNPNILFWDLPGIGTPNYPDLPTFCKKVSIEVYDTFLIISATRFTQNDLELAKKVEEMQKSFFFVRTKIDNDRRSEEHKNGFDEEEMLEKMKNDCFKNLQSFAFSGEKIFLVSNHHPAKWDFDRLKKAILDQLPLKQKESLTLSLRACSGIIIAEKIKTLKGRVWMVAAASVVMKFTLGPFSLFIDATLLRNRIHFYKKQLEFPDEDSNEFKRLSKDLQKKVSKLQPKDDQDLLECLKSFDPDNKYNIRKSLGVILSNRPMTFVKSFLEKILDEMQQTALDILMEAQIN